MDQLHPDLIHSHDPIGTCAASLALQGHPDCPIIQTIHGPLTREALTSGADAQGQYIAALRQVERASYHRANLLLAVDTGQRNLAASDFDVALDKIRIIPNAVDVDEVRTQAAVPGRIGFDQPYFLVPRRFVPKNGVAVATRALSLTTKFKADLVLAGDGPQKDELQLLCKSLGLAGRVQFVGNLAHPDLLPLMRQSVAIVIPSVPCQGVVEATSLSLLEALASGALVIASDLGGPAEIITSGHDGYLFDAGDHAELAARMEAVLQMTSSEREHILANGLATVRNRFGVGRWLDRILDAYENAVVSHAAVVSTFPGTLL